MKQTGLTLLEVMVALLIFAMTGSAMIKAASDHIRSVGMIEEITFATWVANNRLTQLQLETSWPPRNNQKGSQEMAGRTWYWQQFVTQTNDKELRAVEISVSLEQDKQQSITSVSTFIAKPSEGKSNAN